MTEMEEALRKKKRVRGAHRSSVTRLIGQVDEAIDSKDVRRMRQLKQSLTDKSNVLAKLDDELIELVGEEELETEVEQADLIREKICFAVVSIEDVVAQEN